MKRVAAIIALLSAIASAILTFVKMGTMPLDARLFRVGVLGVIAIFFAAVYLRKWALNEGKAKNTGQLFDRTDPAPPRRPRIAAAVIALASGTVLFVTLLHLAVTYHSIVYGRLGTNTHLDLRFAASRNTATLVSISYPPTTPSASACTPFDPDPAHPAAAVLVAPAGPQPRTELTNFVHPQAFGLRCDLSMALTRLLIRVRPPEIRALDSDTVQRLDRSFKWGGFITWLVASVVSGLPSRSRS